MIARPYDNLKIQWFISIVFAVLVGMGAADVVAAVSVTSVSGAVTQGNTVQISGSNFGTHSLEVEWLGNAIEQGAVGSDFSKAGWDNNWGWANAKYTSDAIHSGSKSLRVTVDGVVKYNGIFSYALQNPVLATETLYATWWVRKDNIDNSGQWKMMRFTGNKTIVDGAQEMNYFNWNPCSGSPQSPQIVINGGTGTQHSFWFGTTNSPCGDNSWYRIEMIGTASGTNQSNGAVTVGRYDGSSYNSASESGFQTHVNSGDTWSYAIFQNYIGNGLDSAVMWFDDIYIQKTRARVEICAQSTWASRTHCEIQVPTAWAGTAITIKANAGSFANGKPAYLYVLDAGGNVNASGYPVTIGGSSAVLAAPSNLRVQ